MKPKIFVIAAGVFLLSLLACGQAWWTCRQVDRSYLTGYKRAVTDVKFFVSATQLMPGDEWTKRAAAFRMAPKKAPKHEAIDLGLEPDPENTLKPLQLSQ